MNNGLVRNIVRFVVLILLQVLLFNNMNISSYLNPSVYVLIIMLLPIQINRSFLLFVAFFTGITIDYFGNTLGLHASATLLMAFIRPGTLSLLFRNAEFSSGEEPTPYSIGWGGFIRYSVIMVLIHQITLFYLEALSLNNFIFTFTKAILSTLLSLIIIMIIMLIFGKRRRSI